MRKIQQVTNTTTMVIMDSDEIKQLIKESVDVILTNTISESKIDDLLTSHKIKPHFVPIRYRIFYSHLHSLNIQFGSFIQMLVHKVLEKESFIEMIPIISGKRISLSWSREVDTLIDNFIMEHRNKTDENLDYNFEVLQEDIIMKQLFGTNLITSSQDVDILFRDRRDDIMYYIEVKYNEDYDNNNFIGINRKFLKTYAGLVKLLDITDITKLKPILYFFTKKTKKINVCIPEESHVYRGEMIFDRFSSTKYDDITTCLKNISEDYNIIETFDNLYVKIRYMEQHNMVNHGNSNFR